MNMITENSHNVNNNFEYEFSISLEEKYEKEFQDMVSHADNSFFESDYRKNNFRSKGFVERSIMTQFGHITIRRRRYVNKYTKENFYIDSEVGIDRYARLSRELIFKLLMEHFDTSADALSRRYNISRQTVFNLIYRFKMPRIEIEKYMDSNDCHTVYIEADEDHTRCRKERATYMRAVTIHLGTKQECRNRKKLIDKHTLMFPTSYEIDCVAEYIMDYLSQRYDMDKMRLILNSDGARWIRKLADSLKPYNVIHIYDRFHLNRLLRTLSGSDSEIYYELYNPLKEGDIGKFKKCGSLLIQGSRQKNRAFMTIVNKYEMIRNIFTTPLYEGSRTEGLVSHSCSRYLSSRPKAFSKKRLLVRAMYLSFMHNYGHDYEKAKEVYFGNSKVDKIEEMINVNYNLKYIGNEKRTNIPYLNQPNSYIGKVLHGISHDKLI